MEPQTRRVTRLDAGQPLAPKLLAGIAASAALLIAACSPNPAPPEMTSASVRSSLTPTRVDMPYKTEASLGCHAKLSHEACGGSQTFDLYLPTSGGSKGTIMFIHGGGFTRSDKSDLEEIAPILRQLDAGWAVVNVNYLLTNGAKNAYPSQMFDLRDAATYLWDNAGSLDINMSKFVVAGHSAGGTLATLIGVGHNSTVPAFRGFPPVSGWVSISGIADFNLDPMCEVWGRGWMTDISFPALSTQASPVNHFDRFDPKGYWIHGSQDRMVSPQSGSAMLTKAVFGGFAEKFQLDLVDQRLDGSPLPESTLGHGPSAGANTAELSRWFETL